MPRSENEPRSQSPADPGSRNTTSLPRSEPPSAFASNEPASAPSRDCQRERSAPTDQPAKRASRHANACAAPLPASLRVGVAEERRITDDEVRETDRYYGNPPGPE